MNFAPPNQYQAEQERISREEALAQAMQQQASQGIPAGQMAGQYYVPTNPLQHLAQALKGYGATKRQDKAQADRTALGEKYQADSSADMAMLAKAMQGQQAIPQPADELGGGPGRPAISPQESLAAALGGLKTPQGQQLGLAQYADMQKPVTVGKTLMRRDGTIIATDPSVAAEREAKSADASMLAAQRAQEREDAQRRQQEFMSQQARQAAADREAQLRMTLGARQENRPPVAVMGPDGKPVYVSPDQAHGKQPAGKQAAQLPSTVLKMQNETLEEIGLASSIKSDLGALNTQIVSGQLNLGPIANAWNKLRNNVGMSTQESNNLNSFMTTVERLRNDSLRLNKGVQTEGDAQRVWNELMGNMTDPKVVSQRLNEIQKINERAIDLKKTQIDVMRANFGLDPLETGKFTNQQAAVGGQAPAQADRRQEPRGGKTVVVNY